MSNGYTENAQGGISFSMPTFSFGTTTPAINGGLSFDLPMATIQAFQNQALQFNANNSSGNKAFLDNVINRQQAAVSSTGNRVMDYQDNVLGFLRNVNDSNASTLNRAIDRKKQKSGCFITTAICDQSGKPDDCEELQVLRKFRDDFMLKDESLSRLVKIYYEIAPQIVEAIDKRTDRKAIYWFLETEYLKPAIKAIKNREYALACEIYRSLVEASAQYLEA